MQKITITIRDNLSANAKSVSVTAQIGNISIPINAITLRHSINALPIIEFTTQLSNHGLDGDTGIDLATFQKLNVLVQQKFYNNFSLAPDTIVVVTDGDGNTITFNGYLMQPVQRIIAGQLSLVFSAIHIGAAFQAFNGTVYNTQNYYIAQDMGQYFAGLDAGNATEDLGPAGLLSQLENLPQINAGDDEWYNFLAAPDSNNADLFTDARPPRTDSIAQRIWAIVNGLHTDAVKNTADQTPEVQAILNTSVINANTAVLPYIKHFLMGSLATTIIHGLTAFSTNAGAQVPSDNPLLKSLFNILTEAPNFMSAVLNYINPFLFQLNATWAGQLAFEPNQFTINPGNRIIKAPIEDVSFAMAGQHELPIAQVIVLYPPEDFYAYSSNMGTDQVPLDLAGAALAGSSGIDVIPQNFDVNRLYRIITRTTELFFLGDTLRYLAKYPVPPITTAGRYLTVMAPAWTYPTSFIGKDLLNSATVNENRFNAALTNTIQSANNLNAQHDSRSPILEYLAKTIYESAVLERTNSFVTIPLCVKAQVGRTYTLQSMDGSPLYQGYLRGVVHTLVLSEQGGTATTSLDFSHIIVSGAKLNGINTTGIVATDVDTNQAQIASVAGIA